ncbi:MAG: M20/M25/M40 family metallo-hydrolase [bacterium]|nr:M20/M25/M40 family metallo-hydrolase [bacterium]
MRPRPKNPFDDPRGGHDGRLVLAFVLWIAVHALTAWSARPPVPLSAEAPERTFSAGRAMQVLERLAADLGPHPTGSIAAHELRGKVVREFERLGYTPAVQEAYACGPYGTCGDMRNVVAVRDGESTGPATLVVAHYDSVPAGPGISDDLAGVAIVLEVARALREGRRPERKVIFLISDGEEAGLVGATAFAREHPLMDDVGVVLNLEARGTGGPSMMFETGADNAWLIDAFASTVQKPATSSVSVEVYRRMPNDTDYTVFRDLGIPGLNFAFIQNSFAYHTPLDDVAGLETASVQHHGDNLLAALRGLDAVELPEQPRGDAVYTDVFGQGVLRLSQKTSFWIALGAALALVWGGQRAVRGGRLSWSNAGWGIAAFPILVGITCTIGLGLIWLLEFATRTQRPWHAFGLPLQIALAGMTLFLFAALVPFLGRRATAVGLAHGIWIVWGMLGMFLALFVPGGSYLFFLPATLLGVVSLGVRLTGDVDARVGRAGMCIVPFAAIFWAPVQMAIVDALGPGVGPAIVAPLAVLGSLLMPLIACASPRMRRALVGFGAMLWLLGFVVAALVPRQTEARPGPMNLTYYEQEDGAAWMVDTFGAPLPADFAGAFDFEHAGGSLYTARAQFASIDPPVFELLEDELLAAGERRVRGRVRSPAHAGRTSVDVICGGRGELRVGGVLVPSGRLRVDLLAVGPEGVEIVVAIADPGHFAQPITIDPDPDLVPSPSEALVQVLSPPVQVSLTDTIWGLPMGGEVLEAARPARFVPYGRGDVSRVQRVFDLGPKLEGDD